MKWKKRQNTSDHDAFNSIPIAATRSSAAFEFQSDGDNSRSQLFWKNQACAPGSALNSGWKFSCNQTKFHVLTLSEQSPTEQNKKSDQKRHNYYYKSLMHHHSSHRSWNKCKRTSICSPNSLCCVLIRSERAQQNGSTIEFRDKLSHAMRTRFLRETSFFHFLTIRCGQNVLSFSSCLISWSECF